MDVKDIIKCYILPNGVKVARAFCLRNMKFRTINRILVCSPLVTPDECKEVGPEYDVQKNRRNG